MHILCSTDKNYIMPTGVMMKSVSVNNADENICFHVIVDESVTWWHKRQLRSVVKHNSRHTVQFHFFDDTWIDSYPRIGEVKGNYMTKSTYYRLFVTKMLSEDIDKIIYLDGDIVVVKSLKKLWELDITDYAIAGVTDMSERLHDYKRLGYDYSDGYFNAGVLIINLKYWREHRVIDDFMNIILNQTERIKLHDQDILNIVFHARKKILPLKYNFQNGFLYKKIFAEFDFPKYEKEISATVSNYVIIHYSCSLKPWHLECDHPLRDVWMSYWGETQWRHCRLSRKYPFSFRTKVGNILRKCHLKRQLPEDVKQSFYVDI